MGYFRNVARTTRIALLSLLLTGCSHGLPTRPASAASAMLIWTTPSDAGGQSIVRYDLRVSSSGISGNDTLAWWNSATVIPMLGKTPGAPGVADSVLIADLTIGARYYAVLRSADGAWNWSSFSNVASFIPSTVTGVQGGNAAPAVVLGSPRPTPTSGRAEMNLDLPQSSSVVARVFNAQGRMVRILEDAFLAAGHHILRWDGKVDGGGDAASGVYWIRVAAGAIEKGTKLTIIR
ncbi:MAG TPA: FlgD immunoglobulin-like domain containing protein [Candidatus Dormibacteraeota bacterium]|nr:FlgD immunoglobulin-like domain containing protein [Candidatus Dormibacteraeota bacterium]